MQPPSRGHIRDASRRVRISLQPGTRQAIGVCARWALRAPRWAQAHRGLTPNGACPGYTTEQRKTHITDIREVRYRFHPWSRQRGFVKAVGIRNGPPLLRCRVDDARGFPVLEIPQWMFDGHVGARMELHDRPFVCCQALRDLKTLLVDLQQSSWSPGGTDGSAVETERGSAQFIPDTAPDSGVVQGSERENREAVGTHAAGARREILQRGEGDRR